MIYFLNDINLSEYKETQVKGFVRKGRIVKAHRRKLKDRLKKVGVVIAGVLGFSAATYAAIKFRYISNLNNTAKLLSKNATAVPTTNKKAITFAIGGFNVDRTKNVSSVDQARGLAAALKKRVGLMKTHEVIAFDSKFDLLTKKANFVSAIKKYVITGVRGANPEATRLAQQIYNYSKSNPGKPINLVGYSAGSSLSKDVTYMLDKAGVKVNLVTIGGIDLKLVPSVGGKHIISKNDILYPISIPNSKLINSVKTHNLKKYLEDKEVISTLKEYLS